MTLDEFQSVWHRAPFRRFTIYMADGRTFDVAHPDFVSRSHSGRTVSVYEIAGGFHILDLRLMSELEVHAEDEHAA